MIIFRCNLNKKLGTGHLFRCINLYKLTDKPDKYIIIKDNKLLNLYRDILNNLNFIKFSNNDLNSIKNLVLKHKKDKTKIIVLDIKNTEPDYITQLKKLGLTVITIDDLGKGSQYADYIIDANVHSESGNTKLYGPEYILLDKVFSEYNKKNKIINKNINNIFMFFGGSDPYDISSFIFDNLDKLNFKHKNINLVSKNIIKNSYSNINIINKNLSPNQISELIYSSDLAVISSGIILYETLCCGTPAIIINQNKDQLKISNYYKNLVYNCGLFENSNKLINKINDGYKLFSEQSVRKQKSVLSKKTVDGLAYSRIIKLFS